LVTSNFKERGSAWKQWQHNDCPDGCPNKASTAKFAMTRRIGGNGADRRGSLANALSIFGFAPVARRRTVCDLLQIGEHSS
jgi:hypothetical protein